MKVSFSYPPNIDRITEALPKQKGMRGVMYCYGDTIYSPHAVLPPVDIRVHEGVHKIQQDEYGDIDQWWEEYLHDAEFRFRMECEAYKTQYEFWVKNFGRKMRREKLDLIAQAFCSHIYEWPFKLTPKQAKELLKL